MKRFGSNGVLPAQERSEKRTRGRRRGGRRGRCGRREEGKTNKLRELAQRALPTSLPHTSDLPPSTDRPLPASTLSPFTSRTGFHPASTSNTQWATKVVSPWSSLQGPCFPGARCPKQRPKPPGQLLTRPRPPPPPPQRPPRHPAPRPPLRPQHRLPQHLPWSVRRGQWSRTTQIPRSSRRCPSGTLSSPPKSR